MKNIWKYVFAVAIIGTFSLCSKDKEEVCNRQDIVGVYAGSYICEDDSLETSEMQIEILAGEAQDQIIIQSSTEGMVFTGRLDNCDIILNEQVESIFSTKVYINGNGVMRGDSLLIEFETRVETENDTNYDFCLFKGHR